MRALTIPASNTPPITPPVIADALFPDLLSLCVSVSLPPGADPEHNIEIKNIKLCVIGFSILVRLVHVHLLTVLQLYCCLAQCYTGYAKGAADQLIVLIRTLQVLHKVCVWTNFQ